MFATEPKEPFKQECVEGHKKLSTLHLAFIPQLQA